jgi:hypothetical protein
MSAVDYCSPEWRWVGPWCGAAHRRFAHDTAIARAVSCFLFRDVTTLAEIAEWAPCSFERAAEIVATFVDAGLIIAGDFDPEEPHRPFLFEIVHEPQSVGRPDAQ